MPQKISVKIENIGAMGDGAVIYNGKPLFVPQTAPGDVAEVEIENIGSEFSRGKLVNLLQAGETRQTPPCPYYEKCGGCKLQHVNEPTYYDFKQGLLNQSLARLGYDGAISDEIVKVQQRGRRRTEFKVAVEKGVVHLGFYENKSHNIVDIQDCIITDEAITSLLPVLREIITSLKKPARIKAVQATKLKSGVELVFTTANPLPQYERDKLETLGENPAIVRVVERSAEDFETLYSDDKHYITFGGYDIPLPYGGFVQATEKGQKFLADYVVEHVKPARKIADLYCGCGTYSFPLLQNSDEVFGYEGSQEMVMAMSSTILQNSLEGKLSVASRDLFKEPLSIDELNNFEAVVINPPRNGALPQVKKIAQSNVNKVVYVSCSPATFERDAKELIQAGFKVTNAVAIDQFYWSSHLEVIVVFVRS